MATKKTDIPAQGGGYVNSSGAGTSTSAPKVGAPTAPPQTGKAARAKAKSQGFDVKRSEKKGLDTENTINEWWQGILSGEKSRFGDERVAAEKQKLYETEKGREGQLLDRMNRDAISRGIGRSGLSHRNKRQIALETASRISSGERDIMLQKLMTEFDDKMAALNMAQKSLDSRRQYELGKEQIAATREATRARTALGYAQIAAQKQIASRQAGIAAASLGLSRERFEHEKLRYEESKIPVPPEMEGQFPGGMPPGTFDRIFGAGF